MNSIDLAAMHVPLLQQEYSKEMAQDNRAWWLEFISFLVLFLLSDGRVGVRWMNVEIGNSQNIPAGSEHCGEMGLVWGSVFSVQYG